MSCECWDPVDTCGDCRACLNCCKCPTTLSDVAFAVVLFPVLAILGPPAMLISWATDKLQGKRKP